MTTSNPPTLPVIVFSAVLLAAFFGVLLTAALKDIRTMTIPNGLSIAMAVLYPFYAYTTGIDWVQGLAAGAIVFSIGIVFFALNWLGGGDVKLLSATSLWAGIDLLLPALFITAIAGGVLCVFTWVRQGGPIRIYRRLIDNAGTDEIRGVSENDGATLVPYAVAILAGGTFVAVAQMVPIYRILETVL